MPLNLYQLFDLILAILGFLLETMKKKVPLKLIQILIRIMMISQPSGLWYIFQKLWKLDRTALVNINLFKQLYQLVVHKIILAFLFLKGMLDQPYKFRDIKFIIMTLKFMLYFIDARIIEWHDNMTHVVVIFRINDEFYFLS